MTRTAARVLGWVSAVLLVGGCATSADDEQEPGSADQPRSATSTPVEEPASATGTRAPAEGEAGYDQLPRCGQVRATLLGTPGDDRIVGTPTVDVIVTFGGDDHVSHLREGDRVCAGPDNDTVTDVNYGALVVLGSGDDRLTLPLTGVVDVVLGPGDDTMRVVPGGPPRFPSDLAVNSPCVNYATAVRPVRVDLLHGWARGQGHDRLVNVHCVRGSRFGDIIVGSRYADDIDPDGGNDEVWSLGGNDTVYDNSSPGVGDIFHLGAGDDSAMSGGGPDRVYGDSGNDFVEAGAGADYLEGGDGNDALHAGYRCDGGNSGGAGTVDRLPNEVFGGPGQDHLTGDLGNDRIDGGSGLDSGHGGHEDGRIDWIESVERITVCDTPY